MKRLTKGVLPILLFLSAISSYGQKGFGIGAPAAWIDVQNFSTNIPDTADVAGYYHLLSDYQANAEENDSYVHEAVKVINDRGLTYASSWDWSYDPSYERMTFHSLYVLRGGKKIDHLAAKNFEIIQREENLSRAMYDGSLSVIVNLKDVKAGDIVVYSYSTKGKNPVFKNHYFRTMYLNFRAPVAKRSCRVVASENRTLYFKNFGDVPEPTVTTKNNMKSYRWEVSNTLPVPDEDRTPNWYTPNNRLQVSDFKDWHEFTKWTVSLFNIDVDKRKSPAMRKFVDSLRLINDEEERILAAIKTIQEKIRYFSFSDGLSAYRPHNPSSVFDNKYGDCKDKSLLLSEILNEIGVESYPLLVSTDIGTVMDERLPSPWNFDHCIVQFKHQDSIYYIDPTITSQRGSLKKFYTPDYGFGVVADLNQPGLTKMNSIADKGTSVIRAKEDFEVLDIGGNAKLKVETYYSGREADNVRDGFKSKTKAETNKDYIDFYSNDFPEIKLSKSIYFSDDTVNNAITVYEEYDIPNFWRYDSTNSRYIAETYGRVISGYIIQPSTKVRKAPFAIRYPLDVRLITNIHVPEEWNVTTSSKKIVGPSFSYSSDISYTKKVIRLKFDLLNKGPIVEANKTVEYLNKTDDIYNDLSFQISHSGNSEVSAVTETSKEGEGGLVALLLVMSVVLYFIARRLYLFDPRSRQVNERYNGIENWLILAALGITFSPFVSLYGFSTEWNDYKKIFHNTPFEISKVVLLTSLTLRLISITVTALTAILFWNRRTSTPYLFVASHVVNLTLSTTNAMVVVWIYKSELSSDSIRTLVYAIVAAALWIPYFLISERARGTFTQRLEKKF